MSAPELRTKRLTLTPLREADAAEMAGVLASPQLYEFTGGVPPGRAQLQARYRTQVAGPSGSDDVWHNWVIRLQEGNIAVGFVQATVTDEWAEMAWLVGANWQGRGIATEASSAVCQWLSAHGVKRFTAHIHPAHAASQHVAAAIGLRPTQHIDSAGEVLWSSSLK